MSSINNIIKKIEDDIKTDICIRDSERDYPELHWTVKKEQKLHLEYLNKLIDFKLNYVDKLKSLL